MSADRNTNKLKDFALLHGIVLIWGFTAILGKLIETGPVALVFYRTLFAVIILRGLLFYKKISMSPASKKLMWIMMGTGFLMGLHWMTFFGAARISNVYISLIGLATTTFIYLSFRAATVQRS